MRKILTDLYSLWAAVVFVFIYLSLFPFFVLILQNKRWHRYSIILNKIWSHTFYFLTGLPYWKKFHYTHQKGKNYIFCANHFSFLDISIFMLTVKGAAVFMGKSSLGKIPVFGYMFRNLHISVNRQSNRSRYDAFDKAREKLEMGLSVIIFPEGGIMSKNPPEMVPFKEGAFRLAIEKQVPIVPVSIIDNYKALPDRRTNMRLYFRKTGIIYHEEIPTEGLTLDDIPALRDKIFGIITSGIEEHSTLSGNLKKELP
jgi:1-acyl-sn-glycerol-3-phosphate acyltransferase